MKTLGNPALWNEPKIAFFASRKAKAEFVRKVLAWSDSVSPDISFTGSFHSQAERCVLNHVLKKGKKVVWILGRSLPDPLSREESRAIAEGRLFIVSCFERDHYNFATARYANDMATRNSDAIVFGQISERSFLIPLYRRLHASRKSDVTVIA